MLKLLVTGGAGFIGTNFIHYILRRYTDYQVVNFDKITYAGNPDNLKDFIDDSRYVFIRGDICDKEQVHNAVSQNRPDVIINFAAETHVDRSIEEPGDFLRTDIFL